MTGTDGNHRENRGRRWLIVAIIAVSSISTLGGPAHEVAAKEPIASETSTPSMRSAVWDGWTIQSRGIRW